jgi:hypothetical protein
MQQLVSAEMVVTNLRLWRQGHELVPARYRVNKVLMPFFNLAWQMAAPEAYPES